MCLFPQNWHDTSSLLESSDTVSSSAEVHSTAVDVASLCHIQYLYWYFWQDMQSLWFNKEYSPANHSLVAPKCKGVASHCKVRQSHTVHITKYIWISIFSMCSSMAIMYLVWRGQYPLLGQSQWLSLPGSLQSLASLYLSPGPAPLLWWSLGLEGHPPYQIYDFFFLLLKSAQTIKCQQTCHLCSPQTSHLPACKIFLYLMLTCCPVLFWPDMFVL